MTEALIHCDSTNTPKSLQSRQWDQNISLCHLGPTKDLNLKVENISHAVLQNLGSLSSDLIRIAAYVYAADQSISRGGFSDVYGKHWIRNMTFIIPVQNKKFWEQNIIKRQLCTTLNFLTGDNFRFEFDEIIPENVQSIIDFANKEKLLNSPDCVILFSGGSDSLCAVVDAVGTKAKKPILVSHSPSPKHSSTQKKLVDELMQIFKSWVFPRIGVSIHLMHNEPKESTQRSRSFLYASLGAAIAAQLNIRDIYFADNGIVSLNLPKTQQLVGTLASRSTHPKFLFEFQKLSDLIFPNKIQISNPLLYKTRAESLLILKNHNCEQLLQETISCANIRGRPNITPHCGTCSQCLDRRFGSLAAGMEDHDLSSRYEKDIFSSALKEGNERTYAEQYVRFATELDKLTDDDFFDRFPELFDCILPEDRDADTTASNLIALLRRHAKEVREVIKKQLEKHSDNLVDGKLPDTCLLKLVASGSHLKSDKKEYAVKLANIIKKALPKTFQTSLPINEHQVQNAVEAIWAASSIDIQREYPLLPFTNISTKPDFGKLMSSDVNDWLFIEMKYPKHRERLNSILTEITSRIAIYQKQGAFALFGIYDNPRTVLDDDIFISSLESLSENIWVTIIR